MLNSVIGPSQMDWMEEFRICFLLTPSSNVSTARTHRLSKSAHSLRCGPAYDRHTRRSFIWHT
jgi:hypothetical protein